MIHYTELTSPEAAAAQHAGDLLILPLGAVEQHGGALPLGTDIIRAESVAERVADRLNGRAWVLPTLAYGVSPHHTTLPGTVTLPARLQVDLIVAVLTSLAEAGWLKVLAVNGHGGNAAALGVAQQELLASHPQAIFAYSGVTPLAPQANAALDRAEVSGHCGESEHSQLAAITPHLVRQHEIKPGATALADLAPRARLTRDPAIKSVVTFDQYAPNGVLGDPRRASAAAGERILAEVVDRLTDYAQELLAL